MLKKIRKLVPIAILSILLIACLFFLRREADEVFVLQVNCNGKYQTIDCWHEDGDLYYYFIPSHSKDGNVFIKLLNIGPVFLDEIKLEDEMSIDEFELNKEYTIKYGSLPVGKIMFMCGDKVPTILIDTQTGSTKKLNKNKEYKEKAEMTVLDADGTVLFSNDINSISGRGNGSWEYEKKGYTVTLNSEESILGFREADKYVLVSNHYDDTCGIRNMFAYNMAKEIGMEYACDIQFVNLYINNEYLGLYTFIEKINYNENILDIGNLEEENIEKNENVNISKAKKVTTYKNEEVNNRYSEILSPDNISGGYIIERNYDSKLYDKDAIFLTEQGEGFVVRVPSLTSKEEVEYIQNKMQSIENALFSDNYVDSITGKNFNELVDLDSFVLKYLVDETTKNEGAGSTSSYFYKKKNDELIYGGPVWDYDKSLGNFGDFVAPDGLVLSKAHPVSPTYWYERMYNNEDFLHLVKEYYKDLVKPYCDDAIEKRINAWKQLINDSYKMNYIRWKNARYGNVSDDLDSTIEKTKNWISERVEFLDNVWIRTD